MVIFFLSSFENFFTRFSQLYLLQLQVPIFIFLSAIYFLSNVFLFPFFIFSPCLLRLVFYSFSFCSLSLFLLSSLVALHFLHSSFIASFLSSFFPHLINFLLLPLFYFFPLSLSTLLRYPPPRSASSLLNTVLHPSLIRSETPSSRIAAASSAHHSHDIT